MVSIVDAQKSTSRRRRPRGLSLLPLLVLMALALAAVGFVAYVLWPRWPGAVAAIDAPELPIMVGDVTFNVPPAAIRAAVQRRPGVQERLDLGFLWPSLLPPNQMKVASSPPDAEPQPIDRIFLTIAAANGTLAPLDRFATIYPRYVAQVGDPPAAGLVGFRFRDGTPYQGEDLIYEAAQPQHFFVRCTRDGPGPIPGICLDERRMRNADVTVRFPRAWLADWRGVIDGIDRLVASLKPH
jgi:hypothetical protein